MWILGALGQLTNIFLQEGSHLKSQDSGSQSSDSNQKNMRLEGLYEEHSVAKQVTIGNSVSVSVRKSPETGKNLLYLETDLPGNVVVHWGVCRDDYRKWEIPAGPHPPGTEEFKKKALRTLLEVCNCNL